MKKTDLRRNRSLRTTVIFTSVLSFVSISSAFFVQKNANASVSQCSYLDPLVVDILAFLAALFLVIEGIYHIVRNRDQPFREQWTRSIRVAFGCAILTLHIMQVLHK